MRTLRRGWRPACFLIYDGLGGGVVAEGGPRGLDIRWEFRFVERLLGGGDVLFGDYVVD